MRLASGEIWSIPIVLDITEEEKNKLVAGGELELSDDNGETRAVLGRIEIYPFDKRELALKVFGTLDMGHPGVAETLNMGDYLVGGEVIEADTDRKFS
jgi:sulfate adenylyltransferase